MNRVRYKVISSDGYPITYHSNYKDALKAGYARYLKHDKAYKVEVRCNYDSVQSVMKQWFSKR